VIRYLIWGRLPTGSNHRISYYEGREGARSWARSGATGIPLRKGAEAVNGNVSAAGRAHQSLPRRGAAYLMLTPITSREGSERQAMRYRESPEEYGTALAGMMAVTARAGYGKGPGQARGCILRSKN